MAVDLPVGDSLRKEIESSRAFLVDLNASLVALAESFADREDYEYAEQCLLMSELAYHMEADLKAITQGVEFWRRHRARVKE